MLDACKFLWRYIRGYWKRMVLTLILVAGSSITVLIGPKVYGDMIDNIWVYKSDMKLLIAPVAIVLAAYLGRALFVFFFRYNSEIFSQNIMVKIREDMYKNLGKLDFSYYDKNRTGDIMTKMTADVDMIRHFCGYTMYEFARNIMLLIPSVIYMMTINYKLTLILLVLIPFVGYFAYKLQEKARPCYMENRNAFSALNTTVEENIAGNRVVKAFASEDYEKEKFQKGNQRFKKAQINTSIVWSKYIPPLDMIASLFTVFLILFGGLLAMQGTENGGITSGDILTFSMLLWTLEGPTRMFGWLISESSRFSASVERVRDILDAKPEIVTNKHFVIKDRLNGKIEFRHVNFNYGDDPILQDINFTVEPGQTIALVGPTGSGKSTLINLICRFYDVTEGQVLIDDMDVRSIELKTLRRNISTAMQDIFLFSDTISENIAYGNPDIDIEEVKKVSRVADAESFIHDFPDEYETIIGERGVGLSGGQKQRIALARALLKNPAILILDDTTSSVDMQTEHEIHKTLAEYFQGRTTIIIAHRISSVKHADQIFVLSDGQIIERGTHEDLISRPREEAYYRSVYENQYGDFDNFYKGGAVNGQK